MNPTPYSCPPQVCLLELKIQKLAEILGSVITDTRGRIEKKQAQTYEELQVCVGEADEAHSCTRVCRCALLKPTRSLHLPLRSLTTFIHTCAHRPHRRIPPFTVHTLFQAEQEEAEAELLPEDEDDEDDFVYNPLKLPLGWDGKPIPYWLYKLHGLNQEFKCEICGNYSYWGRWGGRWVEAKHG